MSLEQSIVNLQASVDKLTATIEGKKGKAASTPAEEEAEVEVETTTTKRTRKGKKAKEVTVEQVRESLMALNEAKGKQAAVDVLAQFGVKKIGDLEEAQYVECKEAADAAAAEEDDAEGEGDEELFE